MIVKNYAKLCTETSCMEKMIFLFNPKTQRMVPVDYSSLIEDELKLIKDQDGREPEVTLCYNGVHHVSHFKTCKKPNLFSGSKKDD